MSVEETAPLAAPVAHTSIQQPATPQVAAPVVVPPPAAPIVESEPEDGKEPGWVKQRVERAQKSLLKELGVNDAKTAKEGLEKLRALEEANKTELERERGKASKVEPLERENAELKDAISVQVKAELALLNAEQRAAVLALAGDNPATQAKTILALKPTWVAARAEADAAIKAAASIPPPQAAAPLAPPSTTAPSAAAPAANGTPPIANHLATYESIKSSNPFQAAQYRELYVREIDAAIKQRGAAK